MQQQMVFAFKKLWKAAKFELKKVPKSACGGGVAAKEVRPTQHY